MSTHYETLGVNESATQDEIKKAYRKQASQHHPDKGGDTAKFQEIEAAYRTLSDPAQREQYDHAQRNPGGFRFNVNGADGIPPEMAEIFRNFGFGSGWEHFGKQHQARRNRDMRIDIAIQLSETLEEQVRTVSVQTSNGQRETVQVRIPRGVTHGTTLKYQNLGDNLFNTLPRGDLFVQILLQSKDNFVLQGIDLYTTISVNSLVALVGGEATVTGIDDKQFVITIPEGTQPGLKFRIPGQGLYQINSNNRGHLYAEVMLSTPTVSDEIKEKIKSLINPNQ